MGSNNGTVDTSSAEHGVWRNKIETALGSAKQLLGRTLAPILTTPYTPSNDPNLKDTPGILADLRKMGFKDVETLLSLFTSEVKGYQDDNKFLLENLVKLRFTNIKSAHCRFHWQSLGSDCASSSHELGD